MFIAMNHFKVAPGQGEKFEEVWRNRDSQLQDVPGFVRFSLLRGDDAGDYISHSSWTDREAFVAWTESEAFTRGHRGGSMEGVLQGPPRVALYDAVVEQGKE